MYSEWASLSSLIHNGNEENFSVLGKFPMAEGKTVAISVVKHLAGNLGISQAAEPSPLTTDREVLWCMEVVCFGLSLPLSEHDTIRDCVFVYCEWLSALHPIPKISVPKPVCEDPNLYARKMINHFHNLFVPRKGEGHDVINRQAVLCHRVLRTLQTLAQVSNRMNRETWESLLLFLLAINDTLLGPPTVKDDVGDQLCERVLSVLFEVWLLACSRCFPSPPLWKTFREMCMNWRHRMALIEQWNRANLVLTSKLLEFMYGPSFPELKVSEEDAQLIPCGMGNDCVAQAWFRFLHCIGNPVDLCHPAIISQTQKFLQFAITSEDVVDPYQHPCLTQLPKIFSKAIRGIAVLVDSFLGIAQPYMDEGSSEKKESSSHPSSATHSPTPPPQRRLAKSFSVAPSSAIKGMPKASLIGLTSGRTTTSHSATTTNSGPSSTSSLSSVLSTLGQDTRPPLAPARPKCNSILHMFGEWLFEAAHIGCHGSSHISDNSRLGEASTKRPSSLLLDGSVRKSIGSGNSLGIQGMMVNASPSFSPASSQPASLNDATELPPSLTIEKFESGRAEALGALCRIFCAKKTGEEILPVYLARFYLALQQGLKIPEDKSGDARICGEVLSSIILNSSDLFRLDLDGVQVLVPYVLDALEVVLPDKELSPKSPYVSKTELRRASIHILLSMLVLPLHFQTLPIRELSTGSDKNYTPLTFIQLKPRLMNLLINALQVESDPQNTQMLLGGLLLSVQDAAAYEEMEQGIQLDQGQDTPSNLLSSASDTMSSHSLSDYRSLTEDLPELQEGDAAFGNLYYDYPCRLSKNSAHALFVQATYLVCHRLMSSWKSDLNVSLAALELLAGLARTHIRKTARKLTDDLECKRAVKWLCDYVAQQCSRPPPAHSKDLHSSIVAAFQTAATWLSAHPFLLHDKECLTTVLEVVELGISGTKSQGKPGEPIKMKEEKELKPASMRVRDAAEALLTVILEQVGYFPSPCGAESLSSLLDEAALLRHCRSPSSLTPPFHRNCSNSILNEQYKGSSPLHHFRYFVIENSTMLALLEEPLGVADEQDSQPTVTLLIRGPFGRHAWSMQLRHLPRHKSGSKYHAPNPGRPIPMGEAPVRSDIKPRYFPESVDRIPLCKVDHSIPSLESTFVEDEKSSMEHSHLARLMERQVAAEAAAVQKSKALLEQIRDSGGQVECTPPPVCHEFQTARLFLSHFGFLSSESLKEPLNSPIAPLMALDINQTGFSNDLETLDGISCRTCDTVHLFYVRARQKTAEEILANVNSSSTVNPHFLEFLSSLGWPVSVHKHSGWSGHVSTSWRVTESQSGFDLPVSDHGGSLYNGESKVLYWADVNSEIAFVVPTLKSQKFMDTISTDGSLTSGDLSSGPASFDRSFSDKSYITPVPVPPEKPMRTFSLDLERQQQLAQQDGSVTCSAGSGASCNPNEIMPPAPPPPTRQKRLGRQGPGSLYTSGGDTKVLVIWLESFEDWIHVPIGDLLNSMVTGLEGGARPNERESFVIFLHALQTGLLRVKLQGPSGRMTIATPLVDGMVVSRRVLGTLVRQTSLNMCRRRRLENDTYHPPHVRRRLKIQEMTQKYMIKMSEPELYTYLFSSPPS
ncbi:ral GTPase-activating protein subunit beta isoform X3 [Hetaerina americana]|uniref:ral GTPase-activating protein subunit beta isoform X3 n=1 Tax=Hetaerina americana TaxID=62018 RepID=UPI003A7F488C